MTDRNQADPNEPPEDVAALYSWANLHGAKYRDFSASRAQTREKAHQRLEQVIEEERLKVRQAVEAQRAVEAARAEDDWRRIDVAPPQPADQSAAPTASQPQSVQASAQQPPRFDRLGVPPAAPYPPPSDAPDRDLRTVTSDSSVAPAARPASSPIPPPPMREESYAPRTSRSGSAAYDDIYRPAWLTPSQTESAGVQPPPAAPEDTLQGSRDRLASRWFALQGIFEGSVPPAQAAPVPVPARAPAIAIFSLAGGVGKTSLVATLGRALSGRGERVLLIDTAAYGLLPFFFGARDQRPGFLRTFNPPPSSGDASIQMITLDPDAMGTETASPDALLAEISKHARGIGRVIIDLATASGSIARRVMRISPQILVPLVPDMSSVVSVASIDAFFQHNGGSPASPSLPHYVLNQFDSALPLHLDVREILREQLGDRLLPFALHHSPAVSEALAEGMTVMDYAPGSTLAGDFSSLAAWVKSLSAPATATFRGVRWSEK
jgi:cellulose synthase operon protein YhjQ